MQAEPASPTDTLAQQRQDYARELRTRFAHYKAWAIAHWPVQQQPLDERAFVAAERELELITGAMLHPGEPTEAVAADAPGGLQQAQFEQVTPAPWP